MINDFLIIFRLIIHLIKSSSYQNCTTHFANICLFMREIDGVDMSVISNDLIGCDGLHVRPDEKVGTLHPAQLIITRSRAIIPIITILPIIRVIKQNVFKDNTVGKTYYNDGDDFDIDEDRTYIPQFSDHFISAVTLLLLTAIEMG